jgi:hypothetical protein
MRLVLSATHGLYQRPGSCVTDIGTGGVPLRQVPRPVGGEHLTTVQLLHRFEFESLAFGLFLFDPTQDFLDLIVRKTSPLHNPKVQTACDRNDQNPANPMKFLEKYFQIPLRL